jgi:hypothetical protein
MYEIQMPAFVRFNSVDPAYVRRLVPAAKEGIVLGYLGEVAIHSEVRDRAGRRYAYSGVADFPLREKELRLSNRNWIMPPGLVYKRCSAPTVSFYLQVGSTVANWLRQVWNRPYRISFSSFTAISKISDLPSKGPE